MKSSEPLPELPLVVFSLLIHYPWEMLQIPFFAGMEEISHWEGVKQCSLAAAGDTIISLTAFWAAALTARSRSWFLVPHTSTVAVFLGGGVLVTVLLEALAAGDLGRWEYADRMPTLPVLGTGLIPLLQWTVLPPIVLWLLRRHYQGARRSP